MADLQRVAGPEARRYAQLHPALVVVDSEMQQGTSMINRVRKDVTDNGKFSF